METILKVLIIATSAAMMPNGEPTGLWMEELTTPYVHFVDQGIEVDIATVSGGDVPVDPRSVGEIGSNPESVERFLNDERLMALTRNTVSIDNVDINDYDAVFIPGGHGTMFDMPDNKVLGQIISDVYAQGKVVAALCHGPAGLLGATQPNGDPLVSGKKVAAFTNQEEDAVGLTEAMPFLLQTRLEEQGATVLTVDNFQPQVVVDGRLVTGQNPASSELAAEKVIELLKDK